MAKTSPAPRPDAALTVPAAQAATEPEWPAQAADKIVESVGKVRDKTTGPALKAARWAVFAAFAVFLGTVALVIFVIMAVRMLDVYLPDAVFGETHTWAAHSILGALLVAVGMVLARKTTKPGR